MIRFALEKDLKAIVSIYNEAVSLGYATADTEPVSVESRQEWFLEHNHEKYPIFVWEEGGEILGWCSISPYRRGRNALRFTAEISYYVKKNVRRKGIASTMIRYAVSQCERLKIKTLFAIVLECNPISCTLLEKFGFVCWWFLPGVADFSGREYGHFYYGYRLPWATQS